MSPHNYRSGFLGRLSDTLLGSAHGSAPIAFTDALPLAFEGAATVPKLVVSEFGRTFRENGNRGTDHGHGTVYWVLGGLFRSLWGLSSDQCSRVFQQAPPTDLKLL
jgi:hypothetical protein